MSALTICEILLPEHVEDMIELAIEDVKECMPDRVPDVPRMRGYINQCRLDPARETSNIWLGYKGTECIAFAIGTVEYPFYTAALDARLRTIYIKPSYRGGFALHRLFKAYEQWARSLGCEVSFCGIEREDIQQAAIAQRVFPRMGYKWAGSNYTRRL